MLPSLFSNLKSYKIEDLFSQKRYILFLPIFLSLGIGLYFSLSFEPSIIYSSLPLIPAFILFFWFRKKNNPIKQLSTALLLVSCGFFCAKLRTDFLDTPMLKKQRFGVTLSCIVENIENNPYKKNSQKILLDVIELHSHQNIEKYVKKIRLNAKKKFHFTIGDIIKIKANLFPHSSPVSINSVDLRKNGYFKGISATGNLTNVLEHKHIKKEGLANIRQNLIEKFKQSFDTNTAAIAIAITTGDKSFINEKLQNEFSDSGIAHILAISGLHMAIVIGFIFTALRQILSMFLKINVAKIIASTFSLLIGGLYMVFSGGGYPAIRAFFMSMFFMVGVIINRNPLSIRSISIAAFIILLVFPESISSISFQLSFAAVLGLIILHENFIKIKTNNKFIKNKFIKYIAVMSLTTIVATLATTPIIIQTFQKSTLSSLFGNFFAIPLASFWIMPSMLLSIASLAFGGNDFLFSLSGKGIFLLELIAEKVSSLTISKITTTAPPSYFLPLITVGSFWMILVKKKYLQYIGIVPIVASVACWMLLSDGPPDIFVTKSLIGYRDNNIINISNKNSFEVKVLLKEFNLNDFVKWSNKKENKKNIIVHDFLLTNEKPEKYELINKNELNNKIYLKFLRAKRLITNKKNKDALIDLNKINKHGNCFLWIKNNKLHKIQFTEAYKQKRPWVF